MRVLTIDTATAAASVGLVDGDRELAAPRASAMHAAQHVLKAVDAVLAEAGLAIGDMDGVAVGVGPGSFTGLRIGIATARGIAAGAGIPIAGAATLAALRHAAGDDAVAVVDARRGEVFAEGPGIELAAYAPDDLAGRLAEAALLVGDGATAYRSAFAGCRIPDDASPLHVPAPRSLATVADGPAVPVYVREPDAIPREPGA